MNAPASSAFKRPTQEHLKKGAQIEKVPDAATARRLVSCKRNYPQQMNMLLIQLMKDWCERRWRQPLVPPDEAICKDAGLG